MIRESPNYSKYLEEIWCCLSMTKNIIFTHNLLIFLLAVMNLKFDIKDLNDIYPEISMTSNYISLEKFSNYGKINNQGVLVMNYDDVKKIHNDFQELYLYRISNIKEKNVINQTFKKNQLSDINQKQAQNQKEKYESKYLNANTSDFYEYELLRNYEKVFQSFLISNSLKEGHLNSIKESLIQKELLHCTFTPKIKERKNSVNSKQGRYFLKNIIQNNFMIDLHFPTQNHFIGKKEIEIRWMLIMKKTELIAHFSQTLKQEIKKKTLNKR